MKKQKLIKKIRNLIALDGDEYTDGEVIDGIVELLDKEEKNERTINNI